MTRFPLSHFKMALENWRMALFWARPKKELDQRIEEMYDAIQKDALSKIPCGMCAMACDCPACIERHNLHQKKEG